MKYAALAWTLALVTGCAPSSLHGYDYVSRSLEEQAGRGLPPDSDAGARSLPEGVSVEDGLSEDEAVAVAFWRNAAFHADLAAIGIASADLLQAGLLPDPVISTLFPVGAKQLEATLAWSIDAIIRRPRRVRAARLETERVADDLVQRGLDLARDARFAFADAVSTTERARWASESARLAREGAEIMGARLRLGDVSDLESTAALFISESTADDAARLSTEAGIALAKLRELTGLESGALELAPTPLELPELADLEPLLEGAYAHRPDLRAAEVAVAAAEQRAAWERSGFLGIVALADYNDKGVKGRETGPGLGLRIPIFDANRGGIARADAEIDGARWRAESIRQRVTAEVRAAHLSYERARAAHARWSGRMVPVLDRAFAAATHAERIGEISHMQALETERQRAEAHMRAAEADGALRRARAELVRSIGGPGGSQ